MGTVKSLHLPVSGLGSGLPWLEAEGFPEFDACFYNRFPGWAPIESQLLYQLSYGPITQGAPNTPSRWLQVAPLVRAGTPSPVSTGSDRLSVTACYPSVIDSGAKSAEKSVEAMLGLDMDLQANPPSSPEGACLADVTGIKNDDIAITFWVKERSDR